MRRPKFNKMIKAARNDRISNIDIIAKINESSKKAEAEANERAFLYMLAIPLNVLFNDYWEDSAKDLAPEFIDKVINLYESVQGGFVSNKELADLIFELAGVRLDAEWVKHKKGAV